MTDKHPYYGECDRLAPNDKCVECLRLAITRAYEEINYGREERTTMETFIGWTKFTYTDLQVLLDHIAALEKLLDRACENLQLGDR